VVFGKRIILVEERDHRTAVATTMAHSAAGTNNVVERAATTIRFDEDIAQQKEVMSRRQ
jgi:hypothetical protein